MSVSRRIWLSLDQRSKLIWILQPSGERRLVPRQSRGTQRHSAPSRSLVARNTNTCLLLEVWEAVRLAWSCVLHDTCMDDAGRRSDISVCLFISLKGVWHGRWKTHFRSCASNSWRKATPHSLPRWRVIFFHKATLGHSRNLRCSRHMRSWDNSWRVEGETKVV